MARNIQIGVTLTAADLASPKIRKVVKQLNDDMEKSSSKSRFGLLKLDAAIRIAEKAWRAFSSIMGTAISASLSLRAANDTSRVEVERFGESIHKTWGSIGDMILPVLQGISRELSPMLEQFRAYVDINKKLIGGQLILGLLNFSQTFVDLMLGAARIGIETWYGFKAAIAVVGAAIGKFNSAVFENTGKLLARVAEGLNAIGDSANANKLNKIAAEFYRSAAASEKFAAEQKKTAGEAIEEGEKQIKMAERVAAVTKDAMERTAGAAIKALDEQKKAAGGIDIGITEDHMEESLEWVDGLIAKYDEARLAADKLVLASGGEKLVKAIRKWGEEKTKDTAKEELRAKVEEKQFEEKKKRLSGIAAVAGDIVRTVGGAFQGMVDDIFDGTKSAGEIILGFFSTIGRSLISMLIDAGVQAGITALTTAIMGKFSALGVIGAHAAEAAAGAYAATAAIPFVGPILAPGVAAQAYANTLAWGASVPLAEGGLVRGGIPGIDSVPARMMPGEYVIPAAQVRANVAAGRAPDDSGSASGGGGLTINAGMMLPLSEADLDRHFNRAIRGWWERERRRGSLTLRRT